MWDSLYELGTIEIGAGATTAVGNGTLWSAYANNALMLVVPGKGNAIVRAVADDTHLTIPAWQGAVVAAGSAYQLAIFPQSSLTVIEQMVDFAERVRARGLTYTVPAGQTPNDSIGKDGDIAVRLDPMPFVFWEKVAGHYEFRGSSADWRPKGAYSGAVTYARNDLVSSGNYLFVSIHDTNLNNAPNTAPASTTHWMHVPIPGAQAVLDLLGIHSITVSTGFPTGGQNGDLWFRVSA